MGEYVGWEGESMLVYVRTGLADDLNIKTI